MGSSTEDAIDVFDYVDHRAYLRDYYAHAKRTRRGFSHRAFSRRVGLGSPNHLKRVMDGERNLTLEMAGRFADALGLNEGAADYFVQLVKLNQAKSSAARSRAFDELTTFKAFRKTRKLELAHAAYHSTWFIPAVRELAARRDFRDDPKWIAARLLPPIKPQEAREALETLLALGLLTRNARGRVEQAEPVVSTGPEMHALHIARFHRMMMQKAADSIDLVSSDRRDISSVVVLMGEDGMARIKKRIQRFRREILRMALAEKNASQVVQLNFQVFPLSVARDEEERL